MWGNVHILNFAKSSHFRVLWGKKYASLKKVHHHRLWLIWAMCFACRVSGRVQYCTVREEYCPLGNTEAFYWTQIQFTLQYTEQRVLILILMCNSSHCTELKSKGRVSAGPGPNEVLVRLPKNLRCQAAGGAPPPFPSTLFCPGNTGVRKWQFGTLYFKLHPPL